MKGGGRPRLKARNAKLASAEDVAQRIVDTVKRGQAVVYVPRKWQLIMWVIRHLPDFLFNKTNI